MDKTIVSLIACIAKDRGIGKDNKLLFRIPDDLNYFHRITNGHAVIMGRNTYHSLPNGALTNRRNIVLTRQKLKLPDAEVCESIEKAIESCVGEKEVFIIGGASIYHQSIKIADKLYITEVDAIKEADTFFPDYSEFRNKKYISGGEYEGLRYHCYEYSK